MQMFFHWASQTLLKNSRYTQPYGTVEVVVVWCVGVQVGGGGWEGDTHTQPRIQVGHGGSDGGTGVDCHTHVYVRLYASTRAISSSALFRCRLP